MASLGIPHLQVEMAEDGTKRGEPCFRLRLLSGRAVALGRVLSEGEFRMVALAAFLAELATAEDVCGIVFDDPVSSLDHRHRHAVATRLVREATSRQVVIFTHDLFFLFALRQSAEEERLGPAHYQYVRRNPVGDLRPGLTHPNLPWEGQNARTAAQNLKMRLAQAAISASEPEAWEEKAKGLCTLLRHAWERALEDYVAPVLSRFAPAVRFKRMAVLAVLTNEDVAIAQAGFDWCSKHLHAGTLAQPKGLPSPEDFEFQIGRLLNWVEGIHKRQQTVQKQVRGAGPE